MAELARSAAGLRIFGEDLDPEEITRLLGKAPTRSRRRGRPWFAPNGQPLGISPIGAWHVSAPRVEPGDLDAQIAAILDGLPEDPALWRDLCARYKIDLFCGLFMDGGNEGLRLSPQTLAGLSSRGIPLELDIYGRSDPEDEDADAADESEATAKPGSG